MRASSLSLVILWCSACLVHGQFFSALFGCRNEAVVNACPLDCDLGKDTSSCIVCVCPPCIVCPSGCYRGSVTGGLNGECPGCASVAACVRRRGIFRSNDPDPQRQSEAISSDSHLLNLEK
ncbi:uncharacterized protein LOC100903526 [Galendromus occidentalis]|uniref:Uncharacterized protein LOC100903526 n=1 Tax=Galendromus occidentalis TaxID=34638 RepID=A0AAJ6QY49_9ACAR|nr:uncharacterized protein LOC100903526 [Galendromus occidentalis]